MKIKQWRERALKIAVTNNEIGKNLHNNFTKRIFRKKW